MVVDIEVKMEINGRPMIIPLTLTWDYMDGDQYLVSEQELMEDADARFK